MQVIQLIVGTLMMTHALDAAAYLDPGTGSLILQGLIAGIAVAGMTIKHYWYRIQVFFGKQGTKSLLEDDEDKDEGVDKLD